MAFKYFRDQSSSSKLFFKSRFLIKYRQAAQKALERTSVIRITQSNRSRNNGTDPTTNKEPQARERNNRKHQRKI